MRSLVSICVFMGLCSWAEVSSAKSQSFVDRVYKIQTLKQKSYISFHREPVLYEVEDKNTSVLGKLAQSQKQKKPVTVTVDSLTKKILEVKGP